MYAHVDLPRLAEGKNGGAFWSAFVPCPKNGLDFSDENYADCKLEQLIVVVRRLWSSPPSFPPGSISLTPPRDKTWS